MVQINRSNVRLRTRGAGGSNALLNRLRSFSDTLPYLNQLSPLDRLLVATGLSLVGVVAFSYAFLFSGLFLPLSSADGALAADPRLSDALRRTGLSDAALLRRGGGRRISVGRHALDANENAVALDIDETLDCAALQEETEREWYATLDARRLNDERDRKYAQEQKEWGQGAGFDTNRRRLEADGLDGNEFMDHLDDITGFGDDGVNFDGGNFDAAPAAMGLKLTARHLFCLAADALTLPAPASPGDPDPAPHCDVRSLETRDELLYLWSSARAQMPEDVLKKTLGRVTEHRETLRGTEVHVWYPEGDRGTEGMLRVLNSGWEGSMQYNFDSEPADVSHDDLYRFHSLPARFVGADKLFVDVGSALGLTSMLVSYLYPKTSIVSIEPAAPSWLIQNINYRCNLSHTQLQYIHPILAGVGTKHHDDSDSMMKMVWRPSMTTATRSWNPEKDYDFAEDIELMVRLRTLRSILAEATPEDLPPGTPVSVLNLDCEGCEYNLVPSLHDASFRSTGLMLGRTNWGYIPTIKKPSSDRARETHRRVCTHYNFAKRCKECCDFPELVVRPRLTDAAEDAAEEEKTVAEVAGAMCDGFEAWAKEVKLHDIPDDYGWDEMSAFARDQ